MAGASFDPPTYDLAVIGAGSAGLTAARTASRLGARVLLVERGQVGGDCTWSGCVPSKALLHAAQAAHDARRAAAIGVVAPRVEVDFPRVMGHVRRAIREVYAHEDPGQL